LLSVANPCYSLYEAVLKREVMRGNHVEHVAIIQDGNRRFAKRMGMPSILGHSRGAQITEKVSDWCLELGIKHLTVYAFSIENFKRSEEEKGYLFDLIKQKLLEFLHSEKTHRNRVRIRAIGRIDLLPADLREVISQVEEATKEYDKVYLNIAVAYSGQCEIVDAARALAALVKEGSLRAVDVDESLIARYLYPHDGISVPKVDLIIRTGGEIRTSNFLPWQANGNECAAYFCAPYWPEFRKIDFLRAVRTAQARRQGRSQQA
jgi:tritrans,polycis-undecaprenyl-diphosphate synthase [geranylgeranyl-diphosphate specific]